MEEVKPLSGLKSEDIVSDMNIPTISLNEIENRTFTPAEASDLTVVLLLRIYDMLGAILDKIDPEAADITADIHEAGGLVHDFPYLNLQPEEEEENAD